MSELNTNYFNLENTARFGCLDRLKKRSHKCKKETKFCNHFKKLTLYIVQCEKELREDVSLLALLVISIKYCRFSGLEKI